MRRAFASSAGRATDAFLCLLLGAALAGCAGARRGPPLPDEEIVAVERVWVDSTRPTRAQGDFGGAAERRLPTRLWYAATAPPDSPACHRGRCTAILLAHGFGGNVARLTHFARTLARAGYVVAAPAFPLTGDTAPGGYARGFDDVANQPGDLSFALDSILEAASDEGDPLYGRIASKRIGAVGHSMGGTTVIGATRLDCCADERFTAAVLVAPAVRSVRPAFGATWRPSGPPTLIIAGSNDTVVLPTDVQKFYASIEAPRFMIELDGADHTSIMENGDDRPSRNRCEQLAIAFFDAYLGGAEKAFDDALVASGARD